MKTVKSKLRKGFTEMAKISDSVCLNHPDTPAVTRCATCGKPVCQICVVRKNGSDYCSQVCAANAEKSAGRVNTVMESKKRASSRNGIRTLIVLIVLAALAAAAWYFYSSNKDDVDKFVKKTEKELGTKIRKNAAETRKSIEQGIPTGSKYKANREETVNSGM